MKECINNLFDDFDEIISVKFNESEFINMEQDIVIAIFKFQFFDQINVKYDNFELQNVIVIQDLQGFDQSNGSMYSRHGKNA